MNKRFALVLLAVLPTLANCGIDAAPAGLRPTPPGSGPTVVFDLTRRPLPEIPTPNDVATFADPTSRTGRRINVSLEGPTAIEREAREGFNSMEGWGTFAPITVSFSADPGADTRLPAIDLEDLRARMQNDGHDFSNDAVYVINLTTGMPLSLDLGDGNFPTVVEDPTLYWPNDVRAKEQTLLFETVEEGAGLTQADYKPVLDTDFDGVLDHPNGTGAALTGSQIRGIDNIITWYERETDTLILRPLVPMEEKTEYAVVLTDRLRGPDGSAVRSPFEFVHHPTQKDSVARVAAALGDKGRANYFGDLAGSGLDHVAFAWTFTTQPVYEDMRLLRDGLYGKGPFARLAADYPTTVTAFPAIGLTRDPSDEPTSWQTTPACQKPSKTPFIIRIEDAKGSIHDLLNQLLGLSVSEESELESSIIDNVDHIVLGSFKAPYYMGDPQHEDPGGRFHLNFTNGQGDVQPDTIPFWISVPKTRGAQKQPFPVTMWSHGTGESAAEIITRAGYWAKQGIAIMAIDLPGHGITIDNSTQLLAEVFLRETCMVPWVNGIVAGRAYDLNGDGVPDPGGYLFTAHIFHSRDSLRQSVLDQLMATRVMRSFDGKNLSTQDYNVDGVPDLAGDFDADGVPDLGGTKVPIFTSGDSFGGIVAMMHGALDPYVTASGPISGAGGLMDVATRSTLIPNLALQQVFSPMVIAVPAEERAPDANGMQTLCGAGQRSVRFVVNDLTVSREIEIACLSSTELDANRTVLLTNVATKEVRCVRTGENGRFRVALPTTIGDRLDIQVYDAPDAVSSYKGCELQANAPAGRRITTWEQAAASPQPVADGTPPCDSGTACQQFRATYYPVGSTLVAPQEGLGYLRQSPDFRRLMNLTQAALDPGDPVNFAPYYMLRALPGLDGAPLGPRPILSATTVGDPVVPTAAGNAFARAAGVLPFLAPNAAASYPELADYATPPALFDALGGKTPNQVLIDNYVLEGVARLGRTHAGTACAVNYSASATCSSTPGTDANVCGHALFDADWNSEGTDRYDAPHASVPLRLARLAQIRATDTPSLNHSWAPRLVGMPMEADAQGWMPNAPLIGQANADVNPLGQHVFVFGDPCKSFDDAIYFDDLLIRFFASSGQDIYYLSHPTTHRCLATQSCAF